MATHETTINQARIVLRRANRNLFAVGGAMVQFNKAIIAAASEYAIAHVMWQAAVDVEVARTGTVGTVTLENHGMVEDQFFILGNVKPDRMSSQKEARFAGGFRVDEVVDSESFTFLTDGYGTNKSIKLHRPDTNTVLTNATSAISGISWTAPPDYTYYDTGAVELPTDTLRDPLLNEPVVGPSLGQGSIHSWLFKSNAVTQLAELRLLSVQGLNYVYSHFLEELRTNDLWPVLRFALAYYQDLRRIGLTQNKLTAMVDLATKTLAVDTDPTWTDFFTTFKTVAAKYTLTGSLPSMPSNDPVLPYTPVTTLMTAVQDFMQYQLEFVVDAAVAAQPCPIASKVYPPNPARDVPLVQDC